jgi:helicase required for RNAi-mediated heterochromatin assembly 1
MNLSSLEQSHHSDLGQDMDPLVDIDVLRQFPKKIDSGMDKSQLLACEKMLTTRVAIVQGPPGTGKTFVSVAALKVMIENLGRDDPPILVAAQTNHALDQLLNHILSFQPNIVRLGGRCNKDNEAILKRTLYNLRIANPHIKDGSKDLRSAYIEWQRRCAEIKSALETLTTESLLTAETLRKHRIISDAQFDSLQNIADWEGEDASVGEIADCKTCDERCLIAKLTHLIGLTPDQMMRVPGTPQINLGLPIEDDIENEDIEELEDALAADVTGIGAMKEVADDALTGEWVPIRRRTTGRHTFPAILTDRKIKQMLAREKNLFDIPLAMRGEVYRFFEKQVNLITLRDLRACLKEYQSQVNSYMLTKVRCLVGEKFCNTHTDALRECAMCE